MYGVSPHFNCCPCMECLHISTAAHVWCVSTFQLLPMYGVSPNFYCCLLLECLHISTAASYWSVSTFLLLPCMVCLHISTAAHVWCVSTFQLLPMYGVSPHFNCCPCMECLHISTAAHVWCVSTFQLLPMYGVSPNFYCCLLLECLHISTAASYWSVSTFQLLPCIECLSTPSWSECDHCAVMSASVTLRWTRPPNSQSIISLFHCKATRCKMISSVVKVLACYDSCNLNTFSFTVIWRRTYGKGSFRWSEEKPAAATPIKGVRYSSWCHGLSDRSFLVDPLSYF